MPKINTNFQTSLSKKESILITGGTGSFGKAFVKRVLEENESIKRLVIYSRDELKQYEMAQVFSEQKHPGIRYFIGDIRDQTRLKRALEGIDVVIHAAALKQVTTAEYNPFEYIKTNIIGTQNLIEACLDSSVRKFISLSTDKAAAPINLYGASKLCADKLVVAANNIKGKRDISFSVVRYGNVMGSRGSVIPFFLEKIKTGILPVTDPNMTRFSITLEQATELVAWAIINCKGGEIVVPKIPSYRIMDVVEAIRKNCSIEITGIRPGEKIHEEMITLSDSQNTVDLGHCYAILPFSSKLTVSEYCKSMNAKPVKKGFVYNSGSNPSFISVTELRRHIKKLDYIGSN